MSQGYEKTLSSSLRLIYDGKTEWLVYFVAVASPLLSVLDQRGLQAGGYTWEALLEHHLQASELSGVTTDAEGEALLAYASDEATAQAVADWILAFERAPASLNAYLNRHRGQIANLE